MNIDFSLIRSAPKSRNDSFEALAVQLFRKTCRVPTNSTFISLRGDGGDGGGAGIHNLFTPIVHSTAILAAVLLVGIGAPLLKQFDWVMEHKTVFRGLSYGLLVFLTLWQLLTVVLSLTGPDILKRFTSKQEASKRAAKSMLNPKNKK
ncbi:TPA: hypothetical protein ACQ45K_001682 [Klebsiella variicola]